MKMSNCEELQLRFRACPPVAPTIFLVACQLAAEAFSGRLPASTSKLAQGLSCCSEIGDNRLSFTVSDNPLARAVLAINRFAKMKEKEPDKGMALAMALNMRRAAFSSLVARYYDFLKQQGMLREDGDFIWEHPALTEVGATLPLNDEGTYDAIAFFTALNKLLDKPIPLSILPSERSCECEPEDFMDVAKRLEAMGLLKIHQHRHLNQYGRAVEELLCEFAVLRTCWAKADPETGSATINEGTIGDEVTEWAESNPLLTKLDLKCLKVLLKGGGYPKVIWQNILSEARGKRLHDLYPLLYSECNN